MQMEELYSYLKNTHSDLPQLVLTLLGRCKGCECACKRKITDLTSFVQQMKESGDTTEKTLHGSINMIMNTPSIKMLLSDELKTEQTVPNNESCALGNIIDELKVG